MRKRILLISIFFLSLSFTKASAGWYECYTFNGSIGNYPMELSIQFRDGYFGEKNKKTLNILGVYKYSKYNEPIRLEGQINYITQKVILHEIVNGKYSVKFEFPFAKNSIKGTWTNLSTGKILPLQLDFVAELVDTLSQNQFKNVDLLQSNTLNDFYFVGRYAKISGQDRAQMTELKIINKKDNMVFQTFDFSALEYPVGNLMTIVFDNIEIISKKANEFVIHSDVGRVGGYYVVTYHPKSKRFVLNPEPTAEGPN